MFLDEHEVAALDLAMGRVRDAYDRGGDEDRLIDCWVAFEALFVPDGTAELSYRACMRIAHFVGDTPTERRDLFELLRRSYNARSLVAHGAGAKDRRKVEPIRDRADETLAVLRNAIRRWIEPGAHRSPDDLDNALVD
jgi:hypothetical protein